MKALFLVTELYEPVGGLHRYTTNLISAWEKAIENNETDLDPFIISVKSPSEPLKDLDQATEFKEFIDNNKGVNIYKAERTGKTCYFIEGKVPNLNRFHYQLWNDYGIDSLSTSKNLEWYNDTLSVFWYWAPKFAKYVQAEKDIEFKVADAQDWLAFPAGFIVRDELDIPLNCRIHSGEYGRSLGNPDFKQAPIQIETAALSFADYIQGVSISESTFQIRNLMPFKDKIDSRVEDDKEEKWKEYQKYRDDKITSFLLYETADELVLLKDVIGGMPNGIELKNWDQVTEEGIERARGLLEEELPEKEKFIFFIGRTEYRKGLDFLLKAVGKNKEKYEDVGVVIASSMNEAEYQEYMDKLDKLGIKDNVRILDKWLEPLEKKSIFCASDVIALPSVYEPFGIVALEGLAADYAAEKNDRTGPVVVAGDTGGMDEIITSGVNGFEVPTQNFAMDPYMLSQALLKALDEETRQEISKNGAERVQSDYFKWDNILHNILKIYDKAEENYQERLKFLE